MSSRAKGPKIKTRSRVSQSSKNEATIRKDQASAKSRASSGGGGKACFGVWDAKNAVFESRVGRIGGLVHAGRGALDNQIARNALVADNAAGNPVEERFHRQGAGFGRTSLLQVTASELTVYVHGRKTGWPF